MNWKPHLHIAVANNKLGWIGYTYPTYRILLSNLKKHLAESNNNELVVFRSRRGEWGEWAETWSLVNGKPKITKQGWQ
jgi:hypothetical protein